MIIEKKVADENKKGKRGWWEHKNGNCQNIIYLMMTVFGFCGQLFTKPNVKTNSFHFKMK
jgi:hypothetical protein